MSRRGRVACGNKQKGMRRSATRAPSPNLYNYSADAGAGSATFTQAKQEGDASWRATLLGTVAAGALFFGYGRTARAQVVPGDAQCAVAGNTVTCTGDLGTGVRVDVFADPYTTLNVNSLTQDIAPAAADGIHFYSDNDIIIVSDTGPFAINATGAGARGIYARSVNIGTVTITSTGDITANQGGIYGRGELAVNVDSTGDVTSGATGIDATSFNGTVDVISIGDITANQGGIYGRGELAVNVDSTGDVTSRGTGISGFSFKEAVNIISVGAITAGTNGISAFSGDENVTVNSAGGVTAGSTGIFVRSLNNGTATVTSIGNITAYNTGIFAESGTLNGGGGQAVNVTSTGDLSSDISDGIFARSFGGSTGVISDGNITAYDNAIYARGTQAVNVTSTGNLTSAIYNGIFAQSTAGSMTVKSYGNIIANRDGIEAQGSLGATVTSIGDITSAKYSGIVVFSSAGTMDVTSTGKITANGNGILVSGALAVNVTSTGDVTSATLAGIDTISNASGVTITNMADGTITGGTDAIVSGSATGTIINNFGTVTGNVNLTGSMANAFNNEAGGLFNAGATANLNGGVLTNAGTLSPGGNGAIQTTALTGDLVQTAGGIFAVDIDGATADLINVSGTAALNGIVVPDLLSLSATDVLILNSSGTADNGLSVIDTLSVDYELDFSQLQEVHLVINNVNFAVTGLNSNQTSLANYLTNVFGAGSGGLGSVLAGLGNFQSLSGLADALDQLSPEVYLNADTGTLFFAEEFSNNMFSCAKAGAGHSVMSEGQCLWVRPDGRLFDRDQTAENIGYEENSGGISAGAQVALAPNWYGGVSFGYERGSVDTDTGAESHAHRFAAGGVIKYQTGPLLLAAALSGGIADIDTKRTINFGRFNAIATSDHDVRYVGGQFRAAYLLDNGGWYAKPLVDVNVTHLDRDGISETGGGAANLNVIGDTETFVSVTPAIEIGTEFANIAGTGGVVRPFVKAGVTFYDDSSYTLAANFAGAPGGVGNFSISSEIDDVFGDLEAGVSVVYDDGSTIGFGYEGRLSENTQQHGFYLKGSMKF